MYKKRLCLLALLWWMGAVSAGALAQTLREVVEQAVRTHPEVLGTAKRRLAADEGVKQAQGGYWPRIDGFAGTGKERLDDVDTRALRVSDTTFSRRDAGITISQVLFDGFAVRSEVTRQQARVASSAYGVAATAEEIGLQAIGAYLEVLRRQETVAASQENVDAHQGLYRRIKTLSDGGAGRRVDADQAQSRLALAEAHLRAEQGSLKDAEVVFFRVVGAPPQALVKPVLPEFLLPQTESQALAIARENHPALKAAQAEIAIAEAQNAVAKSALSPRVDLELSANHGNDRVHGTTDDHLLMLRLRYNFFRGGADLARVAESRYQIEEASVNVDRVRRQVEESVSLAWNGRLSARERLVALRQYVESSDITRDAYLKQFNIGQRTLLDLLISEADYYNARLAYVTGQYTELASAFRIQAGMGQLLKTLQIAMPVEASDISTLPQ
jgi:outer membrane protein, adhesin transport system